MARNVERTRAQILSAALSEFSTHGPDGTTMERIAARAGVNKERVYAHMGDKNALFARVIRDELEKVAAAVMLVATSPEEFGEVAGQTYDYLQDNPELARLVLWEGLADPGVVSNEVARSAHYQSKVAAVREAQRVGLFNTSMGPADMVFLLLALASWWTAAPQIVRMLFVDEAGTLDAQAVHQRRRSAVVEAACRLAKP